MNTGFQRGLRCAGGALLLAALGCAGAYAQAPIIVDTAVPIVVQTLKAHHNREGYAKFEGTVMNANIAQITLRARNDELAIRTFTLSLDASAKMQKIVDKGGYQYGDKMTVYFQPGSTVAAKFKGKPSKPL
jgi:hypothetical protein